MNNIFHFNNRTIIGQVIFIGIIVFIVVAHLGVALQSSLKYWLDSIGHGSGSFFWLIISLLLILFILIFVLCCCYFLFCKHTIEVKENEILKISKFLFFKKISSCKKESIKKVISIREGVDQEGPDSFPRYALLIESSKTYLLIGDQESETISKLGHLISNWAQVKFSELGEKQYSYETDWKMI